MDSKERLKDYIKIEAYYKDNSEGYHRGFCYVNLGVDDLKGEWINDYPEILAYKPIKSKFDPWWFKPGTTFRRLALVRKAIRDVKRLIKQQNEETTFN